MLERQVTLLIHGTFANPAYSDENYTPDGTGLPRWWRTNEDTGASTAADQLKQSLQDVDPALAETVWQPNGDDGDAFTYRNLVEWTGHNTHRARVAAAQELATSLDALAEQRGATEADPLQVNVVAHSHGGNVVLEAMKSVSPRVRPRQLCFLGTPLIWRFTDPRILYLGYLFIVMAAGFLGMWEGLNEGLSDPVYGDGAVTVTAIVLFVITLPVMLWIGVIFINIARFVSRLFSGRPAYGPKPDQLTDILGDRPIQLFISPEDEADLMLQLGAAPIDAYQALLRGQPRFDDSKTLRLRAVGALLRLVEFGYIRPFSYVVGAPLIEIVLERVGLGFPFRSVLFHNYEMVTWTGTDTYSANQVVTTKIDATELKARPIQMNLVARSRIRSATHDHDAAGEDRIEALRHTLQDTYKGVREQVQLRHSGYYESPEIIARVAEAIAAS